MAASVNARSIVGLKGAVIAVKSDTYRVDADSTTTKDAVRTGIATGVGAIIGGIAGGGSGAAKGAGAGARRVSAWTWQPEARRRRFPRRRRFSSG